MRPPPRGPATLGRAPRRTWLVLFAIALGALSIGACASSDTGGLANAADGSSDRGGLPPAAPGLPTVRVTASSGVPADLAERVRADVDAAVGFVRTVWDGPWARHVDVTVVADGRTVAESSGLGLAAGQLDGVAAVAVVPVGGPAVAGGDAASGGDPPGSLLGRLVVNAEVYGRLSELGARVVTRHELTHLATATSTPPDMPVWLVEGFADAVGHSGSGSGLPGLAPELAADVSAGWLPTDLPADSAFAGTDGRAAQAYQQAWLACRMMQDEVGIDGLARFYREVGARAGTPAERLDAALADVLGLTYPQLVAAWRDYLLTHLSASNP